MRREGGGRFSLSFTMKKNQNNRTKKTSTRTVTTKGSSTRSLLSLSSSFRVNNTSNQKGTAKATQIPPPTTSITVSDSHSLRSNPGAAGGVHSGGGGGGASNRSLGGLLGGGGSLDTSLHYGKLEDLLCVRIPLYFRKIKAAQFRGLADKSTRRKQDLIQPIICYLDDSLAATESKDFSFDVLVDIHSSLGILYEQQGDSQAAIDYYMSALWLLHKPFKSRLAPLSRGYDLNTQVAINLYRLGTAYGNLGRTDRMQEAYDRAECFREGDIFIAAASRP